MKKLVFLSSLVLAASVAAAPLAFAQDAPSAAVKAAICASATVEAISADEDATVARFERQIQALATAVTSKTETANKVDPDVAAVKGVGTDPTATGVRERIAEFKLILDNPNAPNRAIAQARSDARKAQFDAIEDRDKQGPDLAARLAAAKVDQRNAVALESQVATFVGTRDFAAVKTELCTTPAPTPTPTPTPTPAPAPFVDLDCNDFPLADGRTAQGVLNADPTDPHHLDVDGDKLACEIDPPAGNGSNAGGDFSQVGELPSAIDTGRA